VIIHFEKMKPVRNINAVKNTFAFFATEMWNQKINQKSKLEKIIKGHFITVKVKRIKVVLSNETG